MTSNGNHRTGQHIWTEKKVWCSWPCYAIESFRFVTTHVELPCTTHWSFHKPLLQIAPPKVWRASSFHFCTSCSSIIAQFSSNQPWFDPYKVIIRVKVLIFIPLQQGKENNWKSMLRADWLATCFLRGILSTRWSKLIWDFFYHLIHTRLSSIITQFPSSHHDSIILEFWYTL